MKRSYENHRKALKAAWTNLKAGRYATLSESLKSAWAWVKSQGAEYTDFAIEYVKKETEKAMQVVDTFGVSFWIPKSLIQNVYGNCVEVKTWFYKKELSSVKYTWS